MKRLKFPLSVSVAWLAFSNFIGDAQAQTAAATSTACGAPCPPGVTCLCNPLHVTTVPALVSNILTIAIGMIGAMSLLIFIYGGLIWLTSAGEAGKIKEGKDAMKWAVIGLVIVFTSYALVSFVIKALTG
jgi:hypothetical protein